MKIVDIGIDELNRAARRGRTRSPETQQLIDAISGLKQGQAKAIVMSKGDTPARVRSRLAYAARLAGKRLQMGVEGDRVMFALGKRSARRRRRSS